MKYKKNDFEKQDLIDIQNTMFLTLITTKACNYNCWYCDVLDEPSKTRMINKNDALNIINFIEHQAYKMPNIVIHFFGGEPTLNRDLPQIIKIFKRHFHKKRNVDYLITTNLHDMSTIEIDEDLIYAASFHSDCVGSDYSWWFDRAKILWSNLQLYHVVLMLHEDNMDFIEQMYLENKDEIPCIIAPITQIIGTKEYEIFKEDFIKRNKENPFDDSEFEIFYDKENMGKMYMCRAGFIIDEFGNLFNCWNDFHKDPKYNIFKEPYTHVPIWHPCRNYSSNCDMEVPRASLKYYTNNIKDSITKPKGDEYNLEELREYKPRRILFRCNG